MKFISSLFSITWMLQSTLIDALTVNSDDGFLYVLSFQDPDGTGNLDIGSTKFNNLFSASQNKILLVECIGCTAAKRFVYYKRYTCTTSLDLYYLTDNWMTSDNQGCSNVLGTDFDLFSSLSDALTGTNPWTYCNYNDPNVGMFRDCGPNGGIAGWNMVGKGYRGTKPGKFYIYAPELDACDVYGDLETGNICSCSSRCGTTEDDVYCDAFAKVSKDWVLPFTQEVKDSVCDNNEVCCCCTDCVETSQKVVSVKPTMSPVTDAPTMEPTVEPTEEPTVSTVRYVNGDGGFLYVLSFQDPDGTGNVDVGEKAFNRMFRASESKILLVECIGCGVTAKQFIYYKRYTCTKTLNLYYLTLNWMTSDRQGCSNILGRDFDLYSSLSDALSGLNPWKYCNYNDGGVGMFRDCGPTGHIGGWNMVGKGKGGTKPGKFYIYAPETDACAAYGAAIDHDNMCGCSADCDASYFNDLDSVLAAKGVTVNAPFAKLLCPLSKKNVCCCQSGCTTEYPTSDPTMDPTDFPTKEPTTSPTDMPTVDPTTVPTNNPTNFPTLEPTLAPTVLKVINGDAGFLYVLSFQNPDGIGDVDIGSDQFNQIFRLTEDNILLVECVGCANTAKQYVYYKRYTCLETLDLYYLTLDWMTTDGQGCNNILGTDFDLFSSLSDALTGTNPWKYCNYNDPGVGMFRDCGPNGHIGGWNMVGKGKGGTKPGRFYIYAPNYPYTIDPTMDPTDTPTMEPTGEPTMEPTLAPTPEIEMVRVNGDRGFLYAMSFRDPDGIGYDLDFGKNTFNNLFYTSVNKILLVQCFGCNPTKEYVYYKRYTCVDSVDLYYLTGDWMSSDKQGCSNVLGTDFDLYSSLDDALNDNNPWSYCNYDDAGVGMFRDCGPTGHIGGWNMVSRPNSRSQPKPGKFYIYAPEKMTNNGGNNNGNTPKTTASLTTSTSTSTSSTSSSTGVTPTGDDVETASGRLEVNILVICLVVIAVFMQ